MAINATLVPDLWKAFPAGYLAEAGTLTVCGAQAFRGKDHSIVWYWPQDARFGKPGTDLFDEARQRLDLLPDLEDPSTWSAAVRLLASRCNLDYGRKGVLWVPKAKEVIDRKRWSSGKALVGWTLRTMSRQATFPIPDVNDELVALLRAIAMTNCACGRGLQRDCPQHGEIKARPWRS